MAVEGVAVVSQGKRARGAVEEPRPEPGPGEVLVRVAAVALNYRDRLMIENGMGAALRFPFTPASDMAGTVEATGAGSPVSGRASA